MDGESGAEPSRVGPPPEAAARRRRVLVIAAGVVALVLLAGVGVGLAVLEGNDGSSASSSEPTSNTPASTLPVDEQCTDAIMSNPRWVCLTSAIVADGRFTLDYRGDGGLLNINGGYHLHVYGGDGTNPPAAVMGMHAPPAEQGTWYVEDRRPAVLDVTDERFRTAIGDAPKVCARIADANHHLVPDTNDTYVTGNCVPITRTEPSVTKATQVQPTRGNRPTTTKPTTTTESSTTTDTTTTTTTTELEVLTPGPAT
ncbi:hypothetical protein [Actinophytocola sp.]|uniref:hypothetical protein n=1 Tax=Actinophytocola sp. TaxID=1872138 RepID=UPI002ED158C4